MPTINEVIERNRAVKPDTYDNETKAEWLYKLDGKISREIMHREVPAHYVYPEDGDKVLLVPFPYDDVYDYYLQAMIDYSNKEFDLYNNSLTMYYKAFNEYAKSYIREHKPPSYYNFRNIMG